MIKLEDISKKNVFEVPEGYFESLPGIIQARVAEPWKETLWSPVASFSLKYALPVLALGLAVFFYLNIGEAQSTEDLLTSIDSEQLVSYLEESELNSDDLLEIVPLNADEADAIHQISIEEINVDETDVEDLSDEFGIDYF